MPLLKPPSQSEATPVTSNGTAATQVDASAADDMFAETGSGSKRGGGQKNGQSAEKKARKQRENKLVASIKKQGELRVLLTLMLKAILRSEQRHRDAESVIFDTWTGSSDAGFMPCVKEQTQAYSQLVAGNKGHPYGPPFTYAYLGLLNGLTTKCQDAIGRKTAQILKAHYDALDAMSWQEMCEIVLVCRFSKTYDKNVTRLTLSLRADQQEIRKAISSALSEIEWDRKFGRAPPSFMERELQEFLEAMVC